MKCLKDSKKNIVLCVSILMILGAVAIQVQASTVTLTGQVTEVIDNDDSGVTISSPVYLEISWENESLVSDVGESEITIRTEYYNTMNLIIGDYTRDSQGDIVLGENSLLISDTDFSGNEYPKAHFTDGLLDGFWMYYFDAEIDGVSGGAWVIDANGNYEISQGGEPVYVADDDDTIYLEIRDDSSANGDWFYGEIDEIGEIDRPEPPTEPEPPTDSNPIAALPAVLHLLLP